MLSHLDYVKPKLKYSSNSCASVHERFASYNVYFRITRVVVLIMKYSNLGTTIIVNI